MTVRHFQDLQIQRPPCNSEAEHLLDNECLNPTM